MARTNNILVSNAGIKLVSLGLAVLLEFYFYSQDNSSTQLVSAVLEFQNVPANRMIVDPLNADEGLPAHIEVSGPKSIVRQVAQGFHVIRVPFPENASSSVSIDIKYESLKLPPSVKILSAKPARVTVRTVELLHKVVQIEAATEGLLPSGFELKKINISPKTVIVRGPSQEVQKLESIKLDPINLTGLGETAKFELMIKPQTNLATLSENLVSVELVIEEKSVIKEFKNVPIVQENGILSFAKKLNFRPSTVHVVLKGKLSDLDKISDSLKVVPVEPINKATKKVSLRAIVDDNIFVQKINPTEVIVRGVD